MDKKKITAVCIGIGTAVAVLLVAGLLRSLIKSVPFSETFASLYLWFVSVVGGVGAAVTYLHKKQ